VVKATGWVGGLVAALVATIASAASAGDLVIDTERQFDRNVGVTVKGIRLGRHPDKLRVVLDATGPVNFDYWISEHGRNIVVLIPQIAWAAPEILRPRQDGPIYSISFFPNATGGGVLSILGRDVLGLSAIEQIGPKGDYPYRVVFDIPHRRQDAWLPAGGIMRDGRLLPSHENWPPVQQAATGRTLPVITRATVGRQAPAAAIPDQPQVRQPEPQAPPAKKPLSDQHLSYATER